MRCDHFAEEVDVRLRPFRMVQRYSIYVETQDEEEFQIVKTTVRDVCKVLSDVPRIKHLVITLRGHEHSCSHLMTLVARHVNTIHESNKLQYQLCNNEKVFSREDSLTVGLRRPSQLL